MSGDLGRIITLPTMARAAFLPCAQGGRGQLFMPAMPGTAITVTSDDVQEVAYS